MAAPEGIYLGSLIEAGTDENRNGTPLIYMTFEVIHCQGEVEWEELEKPIQRDVMLYLTEASVDYTHERLRAIGFNGDFDNPQFAEESVKNVKMVCRHLEGQGKIYEEWSLKIWDGKRRRRKPSADVLRELNARWRNPKASTTEDPPDDIPF